MVFLRCSTLIVGCSFLLLACPASQDTSKDKPAPSAAPAKAETAPAQPAAAPAPTAAAPAAAAPTAAAPTAAAPSGDGYGPDGLPAEIPSTRSKVPTVAEWDAVPREISVARSTAAGCETKMLREWLRISCRKKPGQTQHLPTSITNEVGKLPDTYSFVRTGEVTSVVTPVLKGKHYSAVLGWDNASQKLHVHWPADAARPTIKFVDP